MLRTYDPLHFIVSDAQHLMRLFRNLLAVQRPFSFRPSSFRLKALSPNFKIQQTSRGRSVSTKMTHSNIMDDKRVWWKECVVYQVFRRKNTLFVTRLLKN
jgi:hypothetical protein